VASLYSLTATVVGIGIHSYTTMRAVRNSVLLRLCPVASRIEGFDESVRRWGCPANNTMMQLKEAHTH
jgi:hypothetical protein